MSIEAAVAVLRVTDVSRSMEWYATLLGFDIDPFPAAPPYEFCILRRSGVELMLRRVSTLSPRITRAHDWDVYIRLTDETLPEVLEFAKRLTTVVRGPHLMPYGQVEFEVEDPDGYRICIAEALSDTRAYPPVTE
ncbi:MAG: VOC family protein [Gemmatimonadaceae bacterium]|nr:VOC family protein [Gemmatimonadaceae bacterium]